MHSVRSEAERADARTDYLIPAGLTAAQFGLLLNPFRAPEYVFFDVNRPSAYPIIVS